MHKTSCYSSYHPNELSFYYNFLSCSGVKSFYVFTKWHMILIENTVVDHSKTLFLSLRFITFIWKALLLFLSSLTISYGQLWHFADCPVNKKGNCTYIHILSFSVTWGQRITTMNTQLVQLMGINTNTDTSWNNRYVHNHLRIFNCLDVEITNHYRLK